MSTYQQYLLILEREALLNQNVLPAKFLKEVTSLIRTLQPLTPPRR